MITDEEVPAIDKADTTPVTLLADAQNTFNEIGREDYALDRLAHMGCGHPLCIQLLSPRGAANRAMS